MSNQGFFSDFAVDDPLLFYGTEEFPQDSDWFAYVEFIVLARPDEGDGKTAADYAATNDSNASNEDGDEIGLVLLDIGSHAEGLLESEGREELLAEFDLESYSSASIQRVNLHQEGVQWEWRMNEGDQWVIEITGYIGCISEHLHVDALQDFDGQDAYVGISIKASGDDPPLFPIKWAGWTVRGIEKMSEDQINNLE